MKIFLSLECSSMEKLHSYKKQKIGKIESGKRIHFMEKRSPLQCIELSLKELEKLRYCRSIPQRMVISLLIFFICRWYVALEIYEFMLNPMYLFCILYLNHRTNIRNQSYLSFSNHITFSFLLIIFPILIMLYFCVSLFNC